MIEDLFYPVIYYFSEEISGVIFILFVYLLFFFLFQPMIKIIKGRRAKDNGKI